MRVVHLSLADFRNYREAELPLRAGPNLLLGRNGQGKTNLVEAIGYFSTLRSHRVTGDAALVRARCDSAIARMRVQALEREVLLELQLNRDRPNRAQVNRNGVKPRELTRWFSSVLFAPEDLSIVRGDPAGRRRFLDDALVSRMPSFAGVLADYERVLRQRTSLLKSARGAGAAVEATLPVWDDQLIELGSQIMVARRQLVRDLGVPLRSGYASLVQQDHAPTLEISESMRNALGAGNSAVSRETAISRSPETAGGVSRETLTEVAADFRAALAEVRDQELERALTLVGPHRDDLLLGLNDLPVKGYASHGESWSFALSLKLALATLLRGESPVGDPVIILDDVFAELDSRRRERLMSAVGDFEQVIVTAAVEDDVPSNVDWHTAWVDAGRLVRSEERPAENGVAVSSEPGHPDSSPAGSVAETGASDSSTPSSTSTVDVEAVSGIPESRADQGKRGDSGSRSETTGFVDAGGSTGEAARRPIVRGEAEPVGVRDASASQDAAASRGASDGRGTSDVGGVSADEPGGGAVAGAGSAPAADGRSPHAGAVPSFDPSEADGIPRGSGRA